MGKASVHKLAACLYFKVLDEAGTSLISILPVTWAFKPVNDREWDRIIIIDIAKGLIINDIYI